MGAVAVGGFHHHVIGLLDIGRVLDEGLVGVADIAREDELGGRTVFRHPDLNAGRAQQVAHVRKAQRHARGHGAPPLRRRRTPAQSCERTPSASGHAYTAAAARARRRPGAALRAFPLGLALLDVRAVPQHDAGTARVVGSGGVRPGPGSRCCTSSGRRPEWSMWACVASTPDPARRGPPGKGCVLEGVRALLHAAIDQKALPSRFQQGTAAGHLMVRAQKCDLHKNTSGLISSVPLY